MRKQYQGKQPKKKMLESQPEVRRVKLVNLYLYRPVTNRPIQFAYQPAAAAGTFWLIKGILDKGEPAFQGGRNVISGVLIVFHRELLFPDPER